MGVKANPPQFDQTEDLANLRHLNESSVLHTIRQRYASSLPHTYAGQSLIVVNPVSPLAVYSERVSHRSVLFCSALFFLSSDNFKFGNLSSSKKKKKKSEKGGGSNGDDG